eukprot:CAMPEP_0202437824 /NCGR_PEP_ID=MMETSP1345-20130828/31118_1 /ASSEMBLY_ACC=CAM_ASM_000843 /TAXON_ID=342563 /ORGANISM="Fabrea Fabrea salina" /LENGTH=264 /DNA_ID=CAMNT_0049051769 /DNA_START=2650 /DNA_END=3441 /DNA_ORIENTATION=-
MLDRLIQSPLLKEFLMLYPKSQWQECLETVAVVGLNSLSNSIPGFLCLEELKSVAQGSPLPLSVQIPDIKKKLLEMRKELEDINKSVESNKVNRSYSLPHTNCKKPPKPKILASQVESTPKFKGSLKCSRTLKKPPKAAKPKVPKYLQNVNSRIKDSVRKDLDLFKLGIQKKQVHNSPTLEELLCSSRTTEKENLESAFNSPTFLNSSEKTCDYDSGVLNIADDFLKNPLFQSSIKTPKEETRGLRLSEISEENSLKNFYSQST